MKTTIKSSAPILNPIAFSIDTFKNGADTKKYKQDKFSPYIKWIINGLKNMVIAYKYLMSRELEMKTLAHSSKFLNIDFFKMDFISDNSNHFIFGAVGTGKTRLVNNIIKQTLETKDERPIVFFGKSEEIIKEGKVIVEINSYYDIMKIKDCPERKFLNHLFIINYPHGGIDYEDFLYKIENTCLLSLHLDADSIVILDEMLGFFDYNHYYRTSCNSESLQEQFIYLQELLGEVFASNKNILLMSQQIPKKINDSLDILKNADTLSFIDRRFSSDKKIEDARELSSLVHKLNDKLNDRDSFKIFDTQLNLIDDFPFHFDIKNKTCFKLVIDS